MSDSLKYRIPGSSIIDLKGSFVQLKSWDNFKGLVLSNFEGTQLFGFVENEKNAEFVSAIYAEVPFTVSKDDYLVSAIAMINQLKKQQLNKVILSRIKKVDLGTIEQDELFLRLQNNYENAFVYSIKSELLGNWVGATPERLIELKNNQGKTISLAGTKLSSSDDKWGKKEQLEQNYVTNFVESTLNRFASDVERKEIKEYIAGPVKHLVTNFEFNIEAENALKLALELHPTPAVSGFPRAESMKLIERNEQHERRLYAGIIGKINDAEMNLFVNLRSCQIIDSNAYLFVGGGLTIDSVPELEWQETENKALTILNVLQNK